MPLIRNVLTPRVAGHLLLGWVGWIALQSTSAILPDPLAAPMLFGILAAIIAVIVVCAFGVVTQAERLAHRLGDPYGTLVLTLSIVVIEVVLISAVMLGPGDHQTIARDSVMAVAMIILNLVVGVALIIGGTRHVRLQLNRTGASSYLAVLVVMLCVAFGLPHVIGDERVYSSTQALLVAACTLVMYGFFLYRQMGAQRGDFQEVTSGHPSTRTVTPDTQQSLTSITHVLAEHRSEILARAIVLVLTVIPIVLLSHDMAALLDEGLGRLGAPTSLSGLLIAAIVFLPETITVIRAAASGEIQRMSNLCHGALVSTVGLTIPTVLTIGLLTDQPVVLAETPGNLMLLAVTLLTSMASMLGKFVTPLHGAAHLMIFMLYLLVIFA
ncbi:calcium:proton antiporter [Yaniella flava]|uniref:Calcium:proton antiporter n=1 Tax=Yaniella flava TaxID=287930 RepID=A0ABN2UT54_9MICC